MQAQSTSTRVVARFSSCACPIQVLVIDQPDGPASVLIDTLSLLLNRNISVTQVDDHQDALRALEYYSFDVIVVGLREARPIQLTILPWLHDDQPDRPLLVVGRELSRQYQHYARTYGAREVLNVPQRAAELKLLVKRMTERYFDPVTEVC